VVYFMLISQKLRRTAKYLRKLIFDPIFESGTFRKQLGVFVFIKKTHEVNLQVN
jgi:hypothetical protein